MALTRKVIALLGGPPVVNEDDKAAEAITPGHLVAFDSSGDLIKNTTVANVAATFALERDEMGKGIDTAYAIGDQVKVGFFQPGMRVYAFLASGHNVAKGDYLAPQSGGLLGKTSVSSTLRIARSLEDNNTSGSAPVAGTRIRVEIV